MVGEKVPQQPKELTPAAGQNVHFGIWGGLPITSQERALWPRPLTNQS